MNSDARAESAEIKGASGRREESGQDLDGKTGSSLQRWVPLGILVLGLAAFFALDLDEYVSFQTLADNRDWLQMQVADHLLVTALVYAVIYALVVAFSLPGGAIMTITGGFLFGTFFGGSVTVIAATIGSVAVFLAARTALGDVLRSRTGGALARMEEGFKESAFNYMLVLRLIPIFPFVVVNIVPALLGVSLRTYFFGTLIGIIPGTFVYASVGAGVGALFDRGQVPDLGIIFEWSILGPLLGLSALALLPVIHRRFKKKDA